MKYYTYFFATCLFVLGATFAQAETVLISLDEPRPLFEIGITEIVEIDKDVTEFKMQVIQNNKNQPIGYWKIRTYCDKDVLLNTINNDENKCGQAVTHPKSTLSTFSMFFSATDNTLKNFSFKLKAYDTNGKWLHTEKEAFRWK